MDNARRIERLLYVCPEVNCNDSDSFPVLDENDYMGMRSEFALHSSDICLFIFVRNVHTKPFIDIYVWDASNLDGYERFIICDGYRLSEETETIFLKYVHSENIILLSDIEFREINKIIIEKFPQWHYKDYSVRLLSFALQHLYFASHPGGPREILFKAEGLEYIAANLDKLPSYNILGTTPSTIIDQDIPLKLLRILNHEAHFDLLCDQSNREICKAAYRKYRGFIGKKIPSVGQWNYILELYKNDGYFGGYRFKKEIYDKSSNFVYPNEIEAYAQYFLITKELNIPGKIIVPDIEDIWSTLEQLENIIEYKKGNTHKDKLIKARKSKDYRYEYSNNEFEIIMPSCAFDIYKEAISQHNCAVDYIPDHAYGETTILFLRKKDKPNIPFVTMEVGFYDEIMQVYGTCNTLPDKHVYEFIVEYAQAKKISYNLEKLILSNISKIGDSDWACQKELVEFALHSKWSKNNNSTEHLAVQHGNSLEFHQISIEECFPYIDLDFSDAHDVF